MPGIRRVITQSDQSTIKTDSISYDKARYHIEAAVGTLPPTAKYRIFTKAFGTPPEISLSMAGTWTKAGSLSFDVTSRRPGSFAWVGTPSVRMRYQAVGVRA